MSKYYVSVKNDKNEFVLSPYKCKLINRPSVTTLDLKYDLCLIMDGEWNDLWFKNFMLHSVKSCLTFELEYLKGNINQYLLERWELPNVKLKSIFNYKDYMELDFEHGPAIWTDLSKTDEYYRFGKNNSIYKNEIPLLQDIVMKGLSRIGLSAPSE